MGREKREGQEVVGKEMSVQCVWVGGGINRISLTFDVVIHSSLLPAHYQSLLQAHYRRRHNPDLDEFVYPYDLGCRRNFPLVLNWSLREKGDGIHWEVKEGCFEYSFTVSQPVTSE